MKMQSDLTNQAVVYQLPNGALQLKSDAKNETIWANLTQIAELFDTDKSGISRHINNVFKELELSKKATVAKFATVQKEGKREISREIEYFNLDVFYYQKSSIRRWQQTQRCLCICMVFKTLDWFVLF